MPLMKKRSYLILILTFFILSLCRTLQVPAEVSSDAIITAENAFEGIIDSCVSSSDVKDAGEWIKIVLPEKTGGTAEWYILGLKGNSRYASEYDFSEYRDSLEKYLAENEIKNPSARLKFSLLLAAVGGDRKYIDKCLSDSTVGGQGIMSLVFGLHLLNNGFDSRQVSIDSVIGSIVSMQHPDGGWSVTGEYGDVDVTAMVLQALAPNSEKCGSEIGQAVVFLSEHQLEDGDYSSYGSRNCESTAQVLVCLSALGIDCASDERFIKNGNTVLDGLLLYKCDDGSFSHKLNEQYNPSATVQAFYSLSAYLKMSEERGSLYVFSEQKNNIADQPLQHDTSEPAMDNTGSVCGYKPWAIAAVLAVAGLICLIFTVRKKHIKNVIFTGIIAGIAVLIILFTDIKSAGSYYSTDNTEKTNIIGTVTMSIRCDILLDRPDDPKETLNGLTESGHIPKDTFSKLAESGNIPEDGCILDDTVFEISADETAYDLLIESARSYGISIDHKGSGDIAYISGINYLYELDYGDLSGWVYKVNGELPSVGCGAYRLSDGDVIEWLYTLDLGNDTFVQ